MQAGNEIEYGLAGGKNMHVIERMHLKAGSPGRMVIDEVIDAPQAFTQPYKFSTEYERLPRGLIEFDCEQNNRDVTPSGHQTIDMNAPANMGASIPNRTRGSHKHDGE